MIGLITNLGAQLDHAPLRSGQDYGAMTTADAFGSETGWDPAAPLVADAATCAGG